MNEQWRARLANLEQLSADQRLHFFELLAHNLTVAVRGAWSEPSMTAQEQVESLKQLNECLHRVTARVWVQRLNTHEWTNKDFVSMLSETDEQLHPRLQGSVAHSFELSYANVAT